VEVAFDGHLWQMFMQDMEMLTVSTIPSRFRGMAFRNPLFLPFELLGLNDAEECPLCELTLADFQAAGPSDASSSGVSTRLEGGRQAGKPTEYRIGLEGREERLARIEQVDGSGRTLLRMSLRDYRPVPGGRAWYPSLVVVEYLSEVGRRAEVRRYRITALEVNPPLAGERFRIKRGVRLLVDSDRNRFEPLPKP